MLLDVASAFELIHNLDFGCLMSNVYVALSKEWENWLDWMGREWIESEAHYETFKCGPWIFNVDF